MGLDKVSSTIITTPLRVDINRENGDYRDDIGAARMDRTNTPDSASCALRTQG